MIKGLGFGKLLKLLLSTLLIGLFGLLGNCFVNAGYTQHLGTYIDNPYNSSYQVNVLTKGQLMTSFLGDTKNLFIGRSVGSNYTVFFWDSNGLPYLFLNDSCKGEIMYYYVCDELDGNETGIVVNNGGSNNKHCQSAVNVDSSTKNVFGNFLNSMTSSDYYYFNWGWRSSTSRPSLTFCYSSDSIGKSLCFESNSYDSCGLNDYLGLTGFNFNIVDTSILKNPPSYDFGNSEGGNIEGGSVDVSYSPLTGDIMYSTCTKNNALNWYKTIGYNVKMCYSNWSNNIDIYSSSENINMNNFVLNGLDYDDVYIDTANIYRGGTTGIIMSDVEWLDYWRKTFNVYKKNAGNVNNPFVGVPVSLYMLMGNIDTYGLPYDSLSILEFCDLSLYTSSSTLTTAYTGVNQNLVCSSAINFLGNYVNGSGKNAVGSSWDGITNRSFSGSNNSGSSSSGEIQDGLTFQNSFFNLLKSNYNFGTGTGDGFLPIWLVLGFCGILFFKFLKR